MRISVRLFATLCQYIPGLTAGKTIEVELPQDSTVLDLLNKLSLPEKEVKITFVNGRSRPTDWVLRDGDEAGIFPPTGGG